MYVKGQHVPVTRTGVETGEANVRRNKDGQIILDAGAGNDRIDVARLKDRENFYGVTVNGQLHEFARKEMMRLTIKAGAGDDRVFVDPNVDVPIRVDAGRGNDRVINQANGARIDGGAGDDHLINFSSATHVRGGQGNDTVNSHGIFNTLEGGAGRDDIYSRGDADFVSGGAGNDKLNAWGSGNLIRGGRGNDYGFAFGPNNAVLGDGGWNQVGVLNPAAQNDFFQDPFIGQLLGALLQGALGNSGVWGSIDRGFPGNWALDATAALLSGVRRI